MEPKVDRKALVARILASSKNRAAEEAACIRARKDPDRAFLHGHLRNYVLAKYLLPADCGEEDIGALAALSLERSMHLDVKLIHELDQATPCDHATSQSAKKVLLLYAIQRDLGISPDPAPYAAVRNLTELTEIVYRCLTESAPPAGNQERKSSQKKEG